MRPTPGHARTLDNNSYASHPGLITPASEKVRRLQPELFPSFWKKLLDPQIKRDVEFWHLRIAEQLQGGDSRAAVALSVAPLVIAAYTDELDCVALLRFPDELAREYQLPVGARMLTVNTYWWRQEGVASDLVIGALDYGRYGNFSPFIAEFLSNDVERIESRKASIADEEWQRTALLGQEAVARGVKPRDGRPTLCSRPTRANAVGA